MTFSIHDAWQAQRSDLPDDPGHALAAMQRSGLDRLPFPGSGSTRARWRMLAEVSAHDLSLAKLYEAHTDALAILAELTPHAPPPDGLGGVWAAEVPGFAVRHSAHTPMGRNVTLSGKKAWCSGASCLDWVLMTTWGDESRSSLALVNLKQKGIQWDASGWQAVGMARVSTSTVHFEHVEAELIGPPGAYLDRAGFWHGGAGIAACWYGASMALAETLAQAVKHSTRDANDDANAKPLSDPYRLAHLGAVDVALMQARALLLETAAAIDAEGMDSRMDSASSAAVSSEAPSAQLAAMRVRAACETAADTVIAHVGKALGATPFCANARFARMAADLPVFLRQSHAQHDLAAIAALTNDIRRPWSL